MGNGFLKMLNPNYIRCEQCNWPSKIINDTETKKIINNHLEIIFICYECKVELFRCKGIETKTLNQNYCIMCHSILLDKAWKYSQLNE
jgi:hypothetical protein